MVSTLIPVALGLGLLLLIVVLAVEARRHRDRIGTVRHRIHVNGTRGKTEVADLIGRAMRNAGIRTWSKTTGKSTLMVDHNGKVVPFTRTGPPNVREQMGFMGMASGAGADGAVVECMALTPELQMTSTRMIEPTIGIITNVRLDHTDVMGPGLEDIAEAMAATIPQKGIFVTGDRRFHRYFRKIARERGSRTLLSDPEGLPVELKEEFDGRAHLENVAIAWTVCESLCLDIDAFLGTVTDPRGDEARIVVGGVSVALVDALGTNDATSTLIALEAVERGSRPMIGLFVGRHDRPGRAVEMAEGFLPDADLDRCYSVGPGSRLFASKVDDEVVILKGRGRELLDRIAGDVGDDLILFAFGNRMGRPARSLLDAFEEVED